MELMPFRWQQIVETIAGLSRSGHLMVAHGESHWYAAGVGDDPGMYLAVPWLTRTFGLSAQAAVDVFLVGLVLIGVAVGGLGVLGAFESRVGRMLGVAGIALLGLYALDVGDVYVASFTAAAVTVTPALAIVKRSPQVAAVVLGSVGVMCGGLNLVRGQSALPGVVFVLVVIAGASWSRWQRVSAAVALGLGMLVTMVAFGHVTRQADQFLAAQPPSTLAQPVTIGEETQDWTAWRGAPRGHPMWHAVYVGLGYRPNPYGISFLDEVGYRKVAEVDPHVGFLSDQHEAIMRREVTRIAVSDPGFVLRQLWAKTVEESRTVLAFGGIGLLLLYAVRHRRLTLVAFLLGIAVTAAPGVLVVPVRPYLLGLATFCGLFSMWSVDGMVSAVDHDGQVPR